MKILILLLLKAHIQNQQVQTERAASHRRVSLSMVIVVKQVRRKGVGKKLAMPISLCHLCQVAYCNLIVLRSELLML